jgi:transposase-like protein
MLQSNHDGASGREAQRAEGERSAAATGSSAPNGVSDPELVDRPTRRRFSAEYKLDILHRADGCNALGEIGALLRSEGLYSSHLATWRKQREAGSLADQSQVVVDGAPAASDRGNPEHLQPKVRPT